MVNVEADVMVGPLLAEKRSRRKGAHLFHGLRRPAGADLRTRRLGTRHRPRDHRGRQGHEFRAALPLFHAGHGLGSCSAGPRNRSPRASFNPKLYNSFTDGTKAAIEMAAVANGTGLDCPDDGLAFPPAGLHDLAQASSVPASDGGRMARSGLVDIAASQEPDGREVINNIRYGVFVTFKAHNEYARVLLQAVRPADRSRRAGTPRCGVRSTSSASRPRSASSPPCLRNEPTGCSKEFRGDAVATAKKDMQPGEMLDGEGGYAVWANAIPATRAASTCKRPADRPRPQRQAQAAHQAGPDRQRSTTSNSSMTSTS
jgi:predicted homoserine dehydrogenase-like protein